VLLLFSSNEWRPKISAFFRLLLAPAGGAFWLWEEMTSFARSTSKGKMGQSSEKRPSVLVEEVDEHPSQDNSLEAENVTVEEPEEVTEQPAHSDDTDNEQVEILQRKKRKDPARRDDRSAFSLERHNRKLQRQQNRRFFGEEPFGELQPFFGAFGSLFRGFDSLASLGHTGSFRDPFDDDDLWGDDNNVQVYSYSSFQSVGPDGQVREQKTSSKRVGSTKETTRLERDTRQGKEQVSYRREKDGRGREVQQRRDKSGKTWREDKYYNMTPEESEQFEQEWRNSSTSSHRSLPSRSHDRSLGYRSNKPE